MSYVIVEPCTGSKDACCVEVCPVEACLADSDIPVNWGRDIAENARYFNAPA